ncbi:hypothetical protein [Ramlibacter sp.]|uniref:hypothetical protein n=1 Tax=Ramlibacter sp. TaxID=1917967 RepID=UPI002C1ABFCD|nr:hypothetical protein [Ramlibacter sp.]HWI84114.1 hypothetical protein [Ramlibacter sp.]
MSSWKQALREGAISGSVASVLSAAALALAGRRENGAPAAPVNAISHWLWDRQALRQDGPSVRHTLAGYLIHHAASVWWGTWHAKAWGGRARAKRPAPALAGATAAAAVAWFVDYRMTPQRLTPGFEHRLSTGALVAVYACFAVGLALGSMAVPAARDAPRRTVE